MWVQPTPSGNRPHAADSLGNSRPPGRRRTPTTSPTPTPMVMLEPAAASSIGVQRDAGVGEGEDGHHDVADPRVQRVLDRPGRGARPASAGRGPRRDRGVDAGLQRRDPHEQPQDQVGGGEPDLGAPQAGDADQSGRSQQGANPPTGSSV